MYFHWFDLKNAQAVTTTGQFIIQFIGRHLNLFLNEKLKTVGVQYVIYSDTDSVYFTLEYAVEKYCAGKSMEAKVNFVDKICNDLIHPELRRLFELLTKRYLNGMPGYLKMAREVIGDKAIWTAKKRYIINVRDKEGIRKEGLKPSLKVMGLEIAKGSIPKFCREAMKQAVEIVMEKDQETLYEFIEKTRVTFKKLPIEEISFPRSVNGIGKYADSKTLYASGTPYHVKGAILYNHLIDKLALGARYQKIKDGEKIRYLALKSPNPYKCNCIAYSGTLPKEFNLERYLDAETQWQKTFIEPMRLILDAIKWKTERTASLDSMFE